MNFSDLTIGNQIYIKRAECNHTKEYITRAFAPVGIVKDVEFISKTNDRGQKYNGATVTFEKWHAGQATKDLFEQLAKSDDVHFQHSLKYYWVIMSYRNYTSAPVPPPLPEPKLANQHIFFGNELDAWMEKSMTMDASDEAKEWMRFLLMQFNAMQEKVKRWYGDGMEMQIRETRLEILQKELEYQQLLLETALQTCLDEVKAKNNELLDENEALVIENADLRSQLRDAQNMIAFYEAEATTTHPQHTVPHTVPHNTPIKHTADHTDHPLASSPSSIATADTTEPAFADARTRASTHTSFATLDAFATVADEDADGDADEPEIHLTTPPRRVPTYPPLPALELAPHVHTFLYNIITTRFPSPPALSRERIVNDFTLPNSEPCSPFTLLALNAVA
jgi:regulator of replication initiation timing